MYRPTLSSQRFHELLDQVKSEYDNMERELGVYKLQKEDFERKLEAQMNEFSSIKQTLCDLERNNSKLKQQYEEEILRLRRQMEVGGMPMQEREMLIQTQNRPTLNVPIYNNNGPRSFSQTGASPSNGGPPAKKQRTDSGEVFQLLPMQQPMPTMQTEKKKDEEDVRERKEEKEEKKKGTKSTSEKKTEKKKSEETTVVPVEKVSAGEMEKQPDENMVKQGTDWVVVYNPNVKTNMNINLLQSLQHNSVVCCVKFSADGSYLATGSNKCAQIFDVESGEVVKEFKSDNLTSNPNKSSKGDISKYTEDGPSPGTDSDDSYVRSVCFSPDGQFLAAGAEDSSVKVWNVKNENLHYKLEGHELDIYSLDFAPNGSFLVSGSGDGKAKLWRMSSGECLHTLGNEEFGPKDGVTSVAVNPAGSHVAAGSFDSIARIWDVETGKFVMSLEGHTEPVWSLAYEPTTGDTLASGSLDKTVKLWDVRTGNKSPVANLVGHKKYVLSVAFSPDGKWLVSGSKDRFVQFWDPRTNFVHLMLQGHKNSEKTRQKDGRRSHPHAAVISVTMNSKGSMFATGSGDHRARIWKYDYSTSL